MHGIVYVPESEVPGDPLEIEGKPLLVVFSNPWRNKGQVGNFRDGEEGREKDRQMID